LAEETAEPFSFAKKSNVCRALEKKHPPKKEAYWCRAHLAEEAFSFAREP